MIDINGSKTLRRYKDQIINVMKLYYPDADYHTLNAALD